MSSGSIVTIRRIPILLTLTAVAALTVVCQRVPLLAPSGSTITLTTGVTALPVNGSADIIAQVIEPSGTPPQNGTHITFTTTLGTIEPAEAETDISGRVQARFRAGSANGTATITAISGGASTGTEGAIKIAVGTAAVGRVTVNASPASVPNTGGATTISASVFDINGNALGAAPVSFSTTAGVLSTTLAITDATGLATSVLNTSLPATVTASVGAQAPAAGGTATGTGTTTPVATGQASGSVNVTISAAPALVITPPTPPPSAGLPASFTFAVTVAATNGSAVRDVTVDWGDPPRVLQSLGAISGNAIVSHVYREAGTYKVTGIVTDASGNSSTVSTTVTVIPVPRPTIIVTPTPRTVGPGGGTISFGIQITAPAGIGIVRTTINYGDDNVQYELGGGSSAVVPHTYLPGNPGDKLVTVTVVDTAGQTTIGTTSVTIT
ncbi:MAG: PKD domain-containing protein [Acidobacteriota bacterium]